MLTTTTNTLSRRSASIIARHLSSGSFQKTDVKKQADAVTATATSTTTMEETESTKESSTTTSNGMLNRFIITAEVTISKIFPAGFGWQSSSVVAGDLGFEADTLNFALTTGFGDALGVLGGHTAYYALKKAAKVDASIDMKREVHTGILLGAAAFCSGTAWQPIVNALQGAELPFGGVFWGTWVSLLV